MSHIRLSKENKAALEPDRRQRWDIIQDFLKVSEKRKHLKAQ